MLPDAPVFLVQQTYQQRKALAPIGEAAIEDGRVPPGLLLDFGAVPLRGVRHDCSSRGNLAPVMATGSSYGTPAKGGLQMAAWVARKAPNNSRMWDARISEALAEQRSLAVDALVLPGIELSTSGYPNELTRQTDAVRRAWSGRPANDPDWFVCVSLHDDWLTDDTMREFALNQLTDLPEPVGIALHIRFARRDSSRDEHTLRGLREVVRALANDGRRVLLEQTGLVGWLALAWGAWGFSAGMSQHSWLDTREKIRRRPGARSVPRLERYFEPQLLHHVLWGDRVRLARQPGYSPCTCQFCRRLARGHWSNATSSQHGLYALAALTQMVAASSRAARRNAILALIATAERNWAAWSGTPGLSRLARPQHLSTWRALV